MQRNTQVRELPMLAGIAGIIRWVEELANLLSGPLLTLGLGIALIDLLTDGSLLARLPLLVYAWAISQAVGVDAQLVATWDRARGALREGRTWALVGLIALGGVLAYVAWVAAQVFALQEREGVTTGIALGRLGMDSTGWLVQRTALSVFLVCLAGWTRYHPPARDVAAETDAERARLEADLTLEPLRQQVRAQQVRGMRGVVAAALGRETGLAGRSAVETASRRSQTHQARGGALQPPEAEAPATVSGDDRQPPEKPPTGPGSPAGASKRGSRGRKKAAAPTVLTLPGATGGASRRAGGGAPAGAHRAARMAGMASMAGNAEQRIRAIVSERPSISVRALARRAGVSESTASKWLTVIAAEQSQAAR